MAAAETGLPASAFPRCDRPVAEIVSPQWTGEAERDRAGEFDQVARHLDIRPGMSVADVGAGSGYYVVRMAKRVGPQGRVFAEDVTPLYLTGLEARIRKAKLDNVSVIRGEPHDPKLPPASVDVAILVHMYHEIVQPFGLLYNLAAAMKPGGRVGIVDADDIPSRHGTPPALLRCELAAAGYRETGFHDLGRAGGYLAIFAPPEPGSRPEPSSIKPCPDDLTRARQR